ncbi:MAG: ABC transporter permease [Phycisphaerales bacterium]|nr:ABC transporter permease [Phycisphaerales bacterium]
MIAPRYIPVVFKQVWRHRTRSMLTIAGVTVAMFLFIAVQALQKGVHDATSITAADQTLVVYRENRFCPATSRLPERYLERIVRVPGVAEVIPMKVVVNNCRAALDVITYRGVPAEDLTLLGRRWVVTAGSLENWKGRADAAIVGEHLAARRGFKVGESFDSSGVTVNIAAIIRSDEPQDQNVAYVHLPFLQQAAAGGGVGVVTQFSVKVADPTRLEQVGKAIDDEFRTESEPTTTRSEKAFVAQAGQDIVEIVGFTRLLGWGCLAAVLALVANAIVLSVQDRIKEHAVLQTLGFGSGLIARLIIAEGVVIGLIGGVLGAALAVGVVGYGRFSISAEGLSVNVSASPRVILTGLAIAAGVGILAGLAPAWQAGRREIAQCFRAV